MHTEELGTSVTDEGVEEKKGRVKAREEKEE
jgi:hypothetical protein